VKGKVTIAREEWKDQGPMLASGTVASANNANAGQFSPIMSNGTYPCPTHGLVTNISQGKAICDLIRLGKGRGGGVHRIVGIGTFNLIWPIPTVAQPEGAKPTSSFEYGQCSYTSPVLPLMHKWIITPNNGMHKKDDILIRKAREKQAF
jgi:hypothetical protein